MSSVYNVQVFVTISIVSISLGGVIYNFLLVKLFTVKNIFKICYHNIFSFVKST